MSTHHHAQDNTPDGDDFGQHDHAPAPDATAVAAAVGLGLLALGGWLLTTTRPWNRPDGPAVLALYWGSALSVLLCGLVLLRRGVHAVHGADPGALDDVPPRSGHIGPITPVELGLIRPSEPPC
ncbi:hypothetical protein [Streptomyces sp. G-G2]|uniref:hypothetical protein n=1 Tax=Streptomyces sp. G-G2 TaxID=3046201 RepID=UPI0024BA3671|nr:hypothetical protein [Streptomyces sp. G-G2]MDJ0381462.1 hypothetical protein [Streptomyces sp. G-G2]